MLNGFININKTSGLSSNKALSILKYHLKQNNILTKVGHFGTLDPIAEGVLPVALGRATRLFDYSIDKEKIYDATFVFGKETDTLDYTGEVVRAGGRMVSEEEIEAVIPSLTGNVMQIPPIYSAKSVCGVRAYKLARQGEDFSLPPKRVTINSIVLTGRDDAENTFNFRISCGGGTYIRSIVRDMAYAMGTLGYMSKLRRIASGPFSIESSYNVDELGTVSDKILPVNVFTDKFFRYDLSLMEYSTVKNGVPTYIDCSCEDYIAVYYNEEIIGIGEIIDKKLKIKTWLL